LVDRILFLMEKHGVTATVLTKDLKLPSSTVTEWKKERCKPGTEAIIKIAIYFNVSTDYLLGLTDDSTPPSNRQGTKIENVIQSNDATIGVVGQVNGNVHTYPPNKNSNIMTDNPTSLSKQEMDMLKIYNRFNAREQLKFMAMLYDFEETLQNK